ncbi:unnamed protein product [Linum trigynum]|uniref:Uncharacterized protein n=1 Tax=Linum trigynum TaxID=586398 RepID=A0AAV2FUF6_9ROSI
MAWSPRISRNSGLKTGHAHITVVIVTCKTSPSYRFPPRIDLYTVSEFQTLTSKIPSDLKVDVVILLAVRPFLASSWVAEHSPHFCVGDAKFTVTVVTVT